jgi:hypothetical protein
MSNHLEMAMMHSIMTLHQRGWSQRRIARELDIDRETVARHLGSAKAAGGGSNPPPGSQAVGAGVEDSKPATAAANPPPGSEGSNARAEGSVDGVGPPNPPPGSEAVVAEAASPATGPASDCAPYRALIEEKLTPGLSGRRIYQDLAAAHGADGGGGGGGPTTSGTSRAA